MKPNILLIVADDMGYGDFGAFNYGASKTPNLDALMRESVCLTQHYSASALCAPARAALMTGRYPHRTGVIDTIAAGEMDCLATRETTMADIFKAAGYTTGLVGKWHCGGIQPKYHPMARGFDEFVGFQGGNTDYYDWRFDFNGIMKDADGRYATDLFTDEADLHPERVSRMMCELEDWFEDVERDRSSIPDRQHRTAAAMRSVRTGHGT